jgi:hypothetical protein
VESWTWDSAPEKRARSSSLIDFKSTSSMSDTDFIAGAGVREQELID